VQRQKIDMQQLIVLDEANELINAILVTFLGYVGSFVTVRYVASACLVKGFKYEYSYAKKTIAKATLVYFCILLSVRYAETQHEAVYEMLWGCNVSMFHASVGVLIGDRLLVESAVTTVLIDQLCWYVDAFGYLLAGSFPVGVATYMTRSEVPFAKKVTAFHHLWFLPLYLWCLWDRRRCVSARSWFATVILTSYLIVFCRIFVPFAVQGANDRGEIVLNVNLAYEFWDDIDIDFLHIFDRQNPAVYLPFAVFVCNVILNGPPFLLLCRLIGWLSPSSPIKKNR